MVDDGIVGPQNDAFVVLKVVVKSIVHSCSVTVAPKYKIYQNEDRKVILIF